MAIQHYDYPRVKSVVVCGDIHGEFEKLVYQCCVRYKMRDTLIIVAGDCGFGFHAPIYYINFCYGRLYDDWRGQTYLLPVCVGTTTIRFTSRQSA